jgi:hypothetical protein
MSTLPFGLRPPVEGLRVTGEAARETPPEVIELGFDIHGMGATAAFALQDCAIRMMQIGQALTSTGIAQTDLQAGAMTVRSIPMPAPTMGLFGGLRPLLNPGSGSFGAMVPFASALPQARQSCGYDVSSSVKVSLRDTARLAEVVDAVMGSGANVLASFRFLLHDEQALRRTLLEEAVREAHDKAEILAAAVGKSVGRPTSIDEDFRVYQPHPVYANGHPQNLSVMPTFPASITRYPFMGGQLTFHASVSVTYHLQ